MTGTGTVSAILGGTSVNLTKTGAGTTTTLSGANTYTGTTTVTTGTLAYGISNALASGAVTVNGGTLDISTFSDTVGAVTLSSGTIAGTTGVLTGSSYALQGGTVAGNLGAGASTVTTGTTTLNGTSGSLAVNVNSGTLVLGASDRLANSAAVTVAGGTLNTGTALTDTVGSFSMSSGSLTGTGTITAASYGLSGGTVTGNLGAGTTTVTTGTTTLNGTSGSLALNVNSGTLALGASDRLANTAAVTVAGGTLNTGTALTDTVGSFNMSSGSLTGTGTITAASYGLSGGTVTGNLGAGTTTVTTGTTTLNGTSGSLTLNVNSGTLTLGASNRLANTAAVTVAGGVLNTGTFSDTVGAVTLSSGSITGTTGVLTGSSYTMSGMGAVSAILGGTGVNLTKTGAGTTTTLSAANTYTGTTTVSQGNLIIGNGSNAGSVAGSIVVNSGASLSFSRTGSLDIANVITGAGSVDFKGGATYNITAANTYSGGTNLNAGSSLNISEGGSLLGNISNLGSLSYSYTSGERTLATPTTGSGDVSYGGGATYNLTAAQTSTGATRIDSGIVKVSSTGSITGTSSVSVAAGSQFAYNSSTALVSTGGLTLAGTTLAPAVLGGSGVIGSALLVDSLGDTLAPGNSPGTLGFSTSQAWNSFTYNWQVQNFADGIAGIDYDQIAITGGLNLTGSNGSYVLDMESWTLPGGSGGASVRGVVGNLVDTRTSMTILTTTAGITGFDMANWTINRANFDTGAATLTGEYLLSVEGNNMVLTYVPEPDVALLGGIGFIILFRRRRS
jgi:autotransporter-associated beta strand protein